MKFKKGQAPWNKGIKTGPNPEHSKRMRNSVPWNKGLLGYNAGDNHWSFGKKRLEITGDKNKLWKGDKVSYGAIHDWVERNFGKQSFCESCGKEEDEKWGYDWANISGKYKRDREDWARLCRSCHHRYDNSREKQWKTIRSREEKLYA